MKRLFLLLCLALPGLLLPACQFDSGVVICDDTTTPAPPAPMPTSIKEVITQLAAPVQKFSYDPTRPNTFTGAKGTVITIPANAFLRNGRVVTTPVELQVREIFSRADMVLSNMPTVSDGRVLESAGEVFLRASQDSTIRLAPNTAIQIRTQSPPGVSPQDTMRLFVAPSAPVAQTNCFNWTLNTSPDSGISPAPGGYTITVGSLLYNAGIGWLNCDRFYNTPNPLPLVVNVPGPSINPQLNTMVFAVFRSFNGVLPLCTLSAPNTFTANLVPGGASVSVVVIHTQNGKLYYGRQDGIVQAGVAFSPTLQETTPADLVASLNTL
jgi:hypothetical protein